MKKMKMIDLIDIIIKNFQAPISLLEVRETESRLINGLPITYLLRYISRIAEKTENYDGNVDVDEVSKTLLKIHMNDVVLIVEQDTEDNVLNFDIG